MGSKLTEEQLKQLEELKKEFKDVLVAVPGKVKDVVHTIDTGNKKPCQTVMYRVAPKWKEQLRAEIKTLMEAGIVEKSRSPWSSPMVPVRKPDGSVRLCVDYRKVNVLTEPDPYHMPRVDEMVELVEESHFLTKIDLTKGYYQIPVMEQD